MKHLFVPLDIAEELKFVGFNESCFAIYKVEDESKKKVLLIFDEFGCKQDLKIKDIKNEILDGICITAPLYQQVIDWFFKEHDLYILIQPVNNPGQGMWGYDIIRTSGGIIDMWNKDKSVYNYYVNFHNAIKSAIQIIKR